MQKEEAFTQIIKQHEGVIYKITKVYTNTIDDQKDLYQEIVYQLWKSYDSFKGNSKISTWMYRVALNTALVHLKKEKRKGHKVALDNLNLKQENYDPVFEDRLQLIYTQIQNLNDVEKGIILLFLEGKKYEEIALIMGFTASNIGTRMSRIKDKMKKQILK
jgi:RNA polymerase sigma-70 factor (ECF subfamily)